MFIVCNTVNTTLVFVRSVSAPSRTLGRRKLVRNRFTIDTDIVFHGDNNGGGGDSDPSQPPSEHPLLQAQKSQGGDTDRWVEEQFDLGRYDDQGGRGAEEEEPVKETDILSDDDEYCKSVRAPSAEPGNLDGRLESLSLEEERTEGADREEEEEEERERVYGREVEDEGEGGGALSEGAQRDQGEEYEAITPPTGEGSSLSPCAPARGPQASPMKLSALRKQCAVEGATEGDCDVIWVRRDDYANGRNSDVF